MFQNDRFKWMNCVGGLIQFYLFVRKNLAKLELLAELTATRVDLVNIIHLPLTCILVELKGSVTVSKPFLRYFFNLATF